jgi:large subunit ribosomal protein L9
MKVMLKKDVANLGYAGEVMDVADGYGRNYLIPRGLAVIATPGSLKEAQVWRQRAANRMAELKKEHELLAERITQTSIEFYSKAGESGKLYGSVTSHEIADRLNAMLGTDIDRRNLVGAPVRQLGQHRVVVRLSRDFQPALTVVVHPEGGPSKKAQPAAQPAPPPAQEEELFELAEEEEASA